MIPVACLNFWAVYYMQADAEQTKYAKELHERIRREFPEVRLNGAIRRGSMRLTWAKDADL